MEKKKKQNSESLLETMSKRKKKKEKRFRWVLNGSLSISESTERVRGESPFWITIFSNK